MSKPLVSLLILNWNGGNLLTACLDSLFAATYRPLQVIVVDNASTDNSLDILQCYKDVNVLHNPTNLGYAGGNNRALPLLRGDYVAVLNNDITVDPLWLDSAIHYLEADPSLGIVSCRQMQSFQKELIDSLYHVCSVELTFEAFAHNMPYDPTNQRHTTPSRVLSAQGASMIIRRSVFESLAGFDERFWAYHDDSDLCLRALQCGWQCLYTPGSVVYHEGSISFGRKSASSIYYFERNRIWFIYKHFPASIIARQLPWIVLGEARRFRGKLIDGVFGAYMRARIDALRGLHFFRQERRTHLSRLHHYKRYFRRLLTEGSLPYPP